MTAPARMDPTSVPYLSAHNYHLIPFYFNLQYSAPGSSVQDAHQAQIMAEWRL